MANRSQKKHLRELSRRKKRVNRIKNYRNLYEHINKNQNNMSQTSLQPAYKQSFDLNEKGDVCVITTTQELPAATVRDQMIKNRDQLRKNLEELPKQIEEIEANIAKLSGLKVVPEVPASDAKPVAAQ